MSNDSASATPNSPPTTRVTKLPVLRPVELAAGSSGRLDVVVVDDREGDGETPSRSVVLGDSSASVVVAVRASVVLGDNRGVVEAGEPDPRGFVVVGRGRALVEVVGAMVMGPPRPAVVVVGDSTVVVDRASVVTVEGTTST